jgi:hypothetical protein
LPEISEDVFTLTAADATPATRFQRTLLGIGGAFSLTMASSNRMPGPLAVATRMPLATVESIRCGTSLDVAIGDLCTLADALGCEIQVQLVQRVAPRVG